jgi:hypothetical protein
MTRALLQQALEALELAKEEVQFYNGRFSVEEITTTAITAIREYLAQPEQEPVCWINMTGVENPQNDTFIVRRHNIPPHMIPLYLHPKGDE